MKIGILTLPLHANYGGIIQAYALQTVLDRMGHEVTVISRPQRLYPRKWACIKYIKRFIWKYLLHRNQFVFLEKRYNRRQKLIETNTKIFIEQNINLKNIQSLSELKKEEFDAIVVGSDQVWRPVYFCGMFKSRLGNAYLEFAKDWKIKRIAYAPSFGTDELVTLAALPIPLLIFLRIGVDSMLNGLIVVGVAVCCVALSIWFVGLNKGMRESFIQMARSKFHIPLHHQ